MHFRLLIEFNIIYSVKVSTYLTMNKIANIKIITLTYSCISCATSGTLANGQVSCPNMAILKIGPYMGNCCQ